MPRPQDLPPELADGAFAVAEALRLGVTPKRLRAADLDSPFHGVRSRTPLLSALDRCAAYVPRMPRDQFFSHVTAAQLYRIPLPRAHEGETNLHVSVRAPLNPPQARGVVGHRLSANLLLREYRGFRVPSPTETWTQLATVLKLDDLVVAGDFLVQRKRPLASLDELRVAVTSRGRPGIRLLREALRHVRSRTDSPRETLTRLALVRGGLPEPVVGYTVHDPFGGFVATPDLAYVAEKVAIEYQGADHWKDRWIIGADIVRREALEGVGWRVVLVVAADLGHRAPFLVRRVRESLLRR